MSPTMIVAVVSLTLCILGAWPRRLPGEPRSAVARAVSVLGALVVAASLLFPWFEYRDTAAGGGPSFVQTPDPWVVTTVLVGLAAAATLWAAAEHRVAPAGLATAMAWLLLALVSIVLQAEHRSDHVEADFRAGIGVAVAGLAILSIGAGHLGITRMSRSIDLAREAARADGVRGSTDRRPPRGSDP